MLREKEEEIKKVKHRISLKEDEIFLIKEKIKIKQKIIRERQGYDQEY